MEEEIVYPIYYDSFCGRLRAAKQESSGHKEYIFSVCEILSSSMLFTSALIVFLTVPISSIIIGALYLSHCEAQKFIPIYLLVFGSFMFIQNLNCLCQNVTKRRSRKREYKDHGMSKKGACDSIIGCFLFAWFICGNVWVYGLIGKWSPDIKATNYCHPTLYYYAFWLITGGYIFTGFCCIIFSAGVLFVLCFNTYDDDSSL